MAQRRGGGRRGGCGASGAAADGAAGTEILLSGADSAPAREQRTKKYSQLCDICFCKGISHVKSSFKRPVLAQFDAWAGNKCQKSPFARCLQKIREYFLVLCSLGAGYFLQKRGNGRPHAGKPLATRRPSAGRRPRANAGRPAADRPNGSGPDCSGPLAVF